MNVTARSKSLTAEQRAEISRRAAVARWNKDLPKADYEGTLTFGSISFKCAVIEQSDGQALRLVSQAEFMKGLGMYYSGFIAKHHRESEGPADLPMFLAQAALKPFIESNLDVLQFEPISYVTEAGAIAKGNRASKNNQWLTDDIGHPALSAHMHAVLGLMRASQSWDQFKAHRRVFNVKVIPQRFLPRSVAVSVRPAPSAKALKTGRGFFCPDSSFDFETKTPPVIRVTGGVSKQFPAGHPGLETATGACLVCFCERKRLAVNGFVVKRAD